MDRYGIQNLLSARFDEEEPPGLDTDIPWVREEEERLLKSIHRCQRAVGECQYEQNISQIRLGTARTSLYVRLQHSSTLTEACLNLLNQIDQLQDELVQAHGRLQTAVAAYEAAVRLLRARRIGRLRPVLYQLQRCYPSALPDAIVRLILQYTL